MMDLMEAIRQRHSVRRYEEKPIEGDTLAALEQVIADCNEEGGLHIQLVRNEPKAFDSAMAHYGKFCGVTNYIAMIGKKSPDLDERCGYYGEKIVLEAQRLGLNTCWVALTYKKIPSAYDVRTGEKLVIVISIGYGVKPGKARPSKSAADVSGTAAGAPEWFANGLEAALLAPTARNQQKFRFDLAGDKVSAKAGVGICSKIDLGIAKYHFEIGSGRGREVWDR